MSHEAKLFADLRSLIEQASQPHIDPKVRSLFCVLAETIDANMPPEYAGEDESE